MKKLKKMPLRTRKAVSSASLVSIEPLFEHSSLPLVVSPTADGVDLIDWAGSHREMLNGKLREHGGILFRGFPLNEAADLERFIAAVSGETLEYRERSSPRSQVNGNIYTSTDYPAAEEIFPHNENSYQYTWPMKLFFLCMIAPQSGGETPIVDVRRVLQRIDPEVRARFEEKGVRYLRNFNSRFGLPWQTVFQTEDQAEVEAYCSKRGMTCEWREDGLRTISVRSAVERHPVTGEQTWFNHAAFFHITTMNQEIVRSLRASMSDEDLPSNTYYGDGEPIPDATLEALRGAYRDEMVAFPWRKGDLLMLDNMLAAHARAPFEGDRKIVVGMSEPMDREQLGGEP